VTKEQVLMGHATDQCPVQPSPAQPEPPRAPLPPAALEAAAGSLTDLDADVLAHAEHLKAAARTVLATAGRLDLIGAGA
jgi:hypothetical protein